MISRSAGVRSDWSGSGILMRIGEEVFETLSSWPCCLSTTDCTCVAVSTKLELAPWTFVANDVTPVSIRSLEHASSSRIGLGDGSMSVV